MTLETLSALQHLIQSAELAQIYVKLRQINTGQINKATHTDNCYLTEFALC